MTHHEPIHWDASSFSPDPKDERPDDRGPDRRDWLIVFGGVLALVVLSWIVSLFIPAFAPWPERP
ncbi:MAG TPA: hypothetical protein VFA01_07040 [Candidatus Dormibacteraeota bacterium]|jgi:hypothetical protein|nr:hypothetical protein [Candidatus Dormibacteraeota bacterium]